MPIEIRELVIRAVIEPERRPARKVVTAAELSLLKREIVDECVARLREERARSQKR